MPPQFQVGRILIALFFFLTSSSEAQINDYQIRRLILYKTDCRIDSLARQTVSADTVDFLVTCQNLSFYPDGVLVHCSDAEVETSCMVKTESRSFDLERLQRASREQTALERELAGEMVPIPAGSFDMGDLSGEGNDWERPVHSVTVPAFSLGKYEVTFAQWDACVADGGCDWYVPDDEGWGRGNRPVIRVSQDDVQFFIDWLNSKTGGNYRLPTEAEWEYAARAGSTTKYSWGDEIGSNRANCDGCASQWDDDRTAPAGSFPANPWGLHDMHGNVWEWVQDCWGDSYNDVPTDGSAEIRDDIIQVVGSPCQRVLRGGSWFVTPEFLRSASRSRVDRTGRLNSLGFRLARDN